MGNTGVGKVSELRTVQKAGYAGFNSEERANSNNKGSKGSESSTSTFKSIFMEKWG